MKRSVNIRLLAAAFVVMLPLLSSAQVSIDKAKLEIAFNNRNIPSIVFGTVDKAGNMDWLSFGPSVWNEEAIVGKDHIFRIQSMTKALTSVAVMQLVEKDIIGLDDALNELMPEMVDIPILTAEGELIHSTSKITLRHLLTHTSGFGYDFLEPRLQNFNNEKENWPHEYSPRMSEPGVLWRYGEGIDWAGKVVEKLSGKDLETYFREYITGPLGMNSTWFNVPENLHHKIVSYGVRAGSDYTEYQRVPVNEVEFYSGGSGLFSSPEDYMKFIHCILNEGRYENGQILNRESVQMLFERQLSDSMYVRWDVPEEGYSNNDEHIHETDNYSLAWAISEGIETEGMRHAARYWDGSYRKGAGFWCGIYNTYFTIDPNHGFGVVTFMNFLPFDNEALDLYRIFEEAVYSEYKD